MDKTILRYSADNNSFNFSHTVSEPPGKMEMHMHDFYELYYFLSGDVTYLVEGQSYKIESNDLLIMNNKELHRPKFNSLFCYERVVIHFLPKFLSFFSKEEYNLLSCFEERKSGHHNRIKADEVLRHGIDGYLKEIERFIRLDLPETPVMVKACFIQALVAMNRAFNEKKGYGEAPVRRGDERIATVLEYINANLHEDLSLDLLQELFFINKYYLCHLFKKCTGFTVMEYITYKRIMLAKELLSGGCPVTEAAHRSGFGDYSSFYKAFRKLVGINPKKFGLRKN